MNVLSLFDGMSCGQIALNRVGVKYDNYFASEIDKYAIQVTQNNYPNTVQIGDVRNVKAEDLPKIDLLIGGSPCQNFSFAGNRKGCSTKEGLEILSLEHYLELKSEGFEFIGQSYLFWEYVRLLKELKPKYFLLENVKMSKKWADVISGVLGVEYISINSNLVSAQNRIRFYWSNITNINQPKDKGIILKDVLQEDNHVDVKYKLSDSKINRVLNTPRGKGFFFNKTHAKIGTIVKTYFKTGTDGCYIENPFPRKLTPTECERLQTVPHDYTKGVSDTQRYSMLGNGWTVDVICHIFKKIF